MEVMILKFQYKYLELYIDEFGCLLADLETQTTVKLSSNPANYGTGLLKTFNQLGQDGWELVGFSQGEIFEYIFKRQIT